MIKLHTLGFIKMLPVFQMVSALINFVCAGQAERIGRTKVQIGQSWFLIPSVGAPCTTDNTMRCHTRTHCSPQIGSQAGDLARQLAALFVHAPHAVDERRGHTSRIWCSKPHLKPAALSVSTFSCLGYWGKASIREESTNIWQKLPYKRNTVPQTRWFRPMKLLIWRVYL